MREVTQRKTIVMNITKVSYRVKTSAIYTTYQYLKPSAVNASANSKGRGCL